MAAAAGYNRLRVLLGGREPLYHMVNPKNARKFLQSKKVVTPLEAQARGTLKSVEGRGVGMARTAPAKGTVPLKRLGDGRMAIDVDGALRRATDAVEADGSLVSLRKADLIRGQLDLSRPGVAGDLSAIRRTPMAIEPSAFSVPGKNYSTISLSRGKPLQEYGDVGLLATDKSIRGVPIPQAGGLTGPEVSVLPKRVFGKDGLVSELELPQVSGTVLYDPKKTPRDVARKLKAEGAIPLNRGTKARLKRLGRVNEKVAPVDPPKDMDRLDPRLRMMDDPEVLRQIQTRAPGPLGPGELEDLTRFKGQYDALTRKVRMPQ